MSSPPSAAGDVASWRSAGPDASSSVSFAAIAAYRPAGSGDGLVLAVGHDAGTGQAVLYRAVGGSWFHDTLPALAGDDCLTSVSVTAVAAWVVGTEGKTCNPSSSVAAAPLALRYQGGGDGLLAATAKSPVAWTAAGTPSAMAPTLSSVALAGSSGLIGDGAGGIYAVDDTRATPVSAAMSSSTPNGPTASAIRGVAAYGASPAAGFAVGSGQMVPGPSAPTESPARIFTVSPSSGFSAAAFKADPSAASLAGVAATSATSAIAVEGAGAARPAYWQPDSNGVWQRFTTDAFSVDGAHLAAVSATASNVGVTEAVAGDIGGQGAAWRRTGSGQWVRDGGLGGPLAGVAVVTDTDIWAAGGRSVLHFAPVVNTGRPPSSSSGSGSGGSTPTLTGSGSQSPSAGVPSDTQTGRARRTPAISVSEPAATPRPHRRHGRFKGGSRPLGRLLGHVAVHVTTGNLTVSFVLTRRARVAVSVKRAGLTVGNTGWRVFPSGSRRVTLGYSGRVAPDSVLITARPAGR